MRRRLLILGWVLLWVIPVSAQFDVQNYRTIDGRYNNLQNPEWGAAHTRMPRLMGAYYGDGISSPGGVNRPNPRAISNALFAQNGILSEPMGLSDFFWVFGQFLDHDFGLTPDIEDPLLISVPAGDQFFDPLGTGRVVIPMKRNMFDPATGTGPGNPREHMNILTSYIDGSAFYGSDDKRANWLRTFEGGKLKVSRGNMLPFNTVNLEYDGAIDPNAPHMDNPVGRSKKLYVAGDSRANENPLLASFHTLFVREHNRVCEELAQKHPDWTDEQLYQHARKIVGGILQSIVFNEWLPAVKIQLPAYTGYKPDVDASLMNEFTAAAFRLGHTFLNGTLRRIRTNGELHPEGHVALRDAFFNVEMLEQSGGLDIFLQGMGTQVAQVFDAKIVDDVRNFLFGPPGAGGLDLAAININRGRERGIPDFNSVRKALGLPPYLMFQQISTHPHVFHALLRNYRSVNNIDLWVGLLAEGRPSGEVLGPTLKAFLTKQFTALRDGDRFFFENDPVLSAEEKEEIRNTVFYNVIMRNTTLKLMQHDVFHAMPFEEMCSDMAVDVAGNISMEDGTPLYNVSVKIGMSDGAMQINSDGGGNYSFSAVPSCKAQEMSLSMQDSPLNGVNTADVIRLYKHILGRELLDTPYKILAADVDESGAVTVGDLLQLQRLVLGVITEFKPGDSAWRFVPADFTFTDPANPFLDSYPKSMDFDLPTKDMHQDFIAIKLGDLNNSYHGPALALRSNGAKALTFALEEQSFRPGDAVAVAFRARDIAQFQGYQFALGFDPETLVFENAEAGALPKLNTANFGIFAEEGIISTSWFTQAPADLNGLDSEAVLFTLHFTALGNGKLSDHLLLDRRIIRAEAYDSGLREQGLNLAFGASITASTSQLEVFQNRPNPFADETVVPFHLPETGQVTLRVFDVSGRELLRQSANFDAGYQQWTIRSSDIPAAGVLYYRVETASGAVTRKMLRVQP